MRISLVLLMVVSMACLVEAGEKKGGAHPRLFLEKGALVYSDDFDGAFNVKQWEVRQQTKWVTEGGQLVGSGAPLAYQEEMKAKNDSHTGEGPIIRLNGVPREFVCHMRLKYEGADYVQGRPLLDVGHHKNSFLFSAGNARLNLDKGKKIINRAADMLPLNQWVDVTIELAEGKMAVVLNGHKQVYENALITMEGHSEFTFKAIPKGRILFEYVKVWEAGGK